MKLPHWHYWHEIEPVDMPPAPGYRYERCRCGLIRKRKPCLVQTGFGYADGWWESFLRNGAWFEPIKVL